MLIIGILIPGAPAYAGPPPASGIVFETTAPGAWFTAQPGELMWLVNQNGSDEVFWIGNATGFSNPGQLFHSWVQADGNWSGAYSLGGLIYDSFCGMRNPGGTLEIYVKAAGGDVNHKRQLWPAGDWGGWENDIGGRIKTGYGVNCAHSTSGSKVAVKVYGPDNWWHYKTRLITGEWPSTWA
ncbi:hypothetical protein [Micromonospora sp. NPDC005237]|uniref:hypothetical protein n=1 Tax=unclassified Micromonospora TaxID=2617518 RepID=UPI0033BC7965